MFVNSTVKASGQTWLSDWHYCLPFTINGTLIDEELINFPICINLTNSELFSVIGDNYQKIAVADENASIAYVEVVYWSSGENYAELWTCLNISSSEDTTFYLYFDLGHISNSYIGLTGTSQAKAVWTNGYVLVDHMGDYGDTSHTRDSTIYSNDGTKKGAAEPSETTGLINYGQDFAGDDDYIAMNALTEVVAGGNWEISVWFNPDGSALDHLVCSCNGASDRKGVYVNGDTAGVSVYNGVSYSNKGGTASTVNIGEWNRAAAVSDSGSLSFYINIFDDSGTPGNVNPGLDNRVSVGAKSDLVTNIYAGLIDELHISNVTRSDAWEKASYYSEKNALCSEGPIEIYVVPTPTPPEYSNEEIIGVTIALIITFFSVALVFTLVRRKRND